MVSFKNRIYAQYVDSRNPPGRECASASDTTVGTNPYLHRLVRKHFPRARDAAIVDLGCGDGSLLRTARDLGYTSAWGIDCSPQQVARAHRAGLTNVVLGDLREALAGVTDESQDCVVALDVLEHFGRDDIGQICDAVHRVLRSGGQFIAHVPNCESPFGARIRYGDLTHETGFTRASIEQLFAVVGFRDARCFEDVPVVHGPVSAGRFVLWHLLRTAAATWIAVETGSGRRAIVSQGLIAIGIK